MHLAAATPLTLLLLAATALVSMAAFGNQRLFGALLFEPFAIRERAQWHRFITHAFVHANWAHLLVNLFVLFTFGQHVERALAGITPASGLVFGLLYLGGIVFSALPGYRRHAANPDYRAVGASGAVSAVLFAYIMMTPTNGIRFLFFPQPVPAWVFGALYLAYSWHMDRRGGDNVAHDAHFFGALFGIVFMAIAHPAVVPAFFEQLRS